MAKRKKRRRKYKLKPIPILILVLILLTPTFLIFIPAKNIDFENVSSNQDLISENNKVSSEILLEQDNKEPTSSNITELETASSSSTQSSKLEESNKSIDKKSWQLKLVNKDNPISTNIEIQKTKFDSEYIDSRIASNYEKMYVDAKKAGITLFLRSGYRTVSVQKSNYDTSIKNYIKSGKSNEEATKLTDEYYAKPGESEHHTGLALDIITPEYHKDVYSLTAEFAKTDAYKWLQSNSYKYGFILRYPENKTNITGFSFEPWHYRYVGEDSAKYIFENNLCLEEYLKL